MPRRSEKSPASPFPKPGGRELPAVLVRIVIQARKAQPTRKSYRIVLTTKRIDVQQPPERLPRFRSAPEADSFRETFQEARQIDSRAVHIPAQRARGGDERGHIDEHRRRHAELDQIFVPARRNRARPSGAAYHGGKPGFNRIALRASSIALSG